MPCESVSFTTTLRGQSVAFEMRYVEKDGEPWVAAGDLCAALDMFQEAQNGRPYTDTKAMARWMDPTGIFRAVGAQRRGPFLMVLRRDLVLKLIERSFRHYAEDLRLWLDETLYKPEQAGGVFMCDWQIQRGFQNWTLTKAQRLGNLAEIEAGRQGIVLHRQPVKIVSGGKQVDGHLVLWPAGFLDRVFQALEAK